MDRTKLKDVLNRLQNWSDDSETLARHLDPATGNPANPGFLPTPLVLPVRDKKKYLNSDGFPPLEASMARAADLLESFAANNSAILNFLHLATSDPPTADQQIPDVTEDQLLALSTNWILLLGEQLKAMLKLYGDIPGPFPPAPHPGGTSEYRLAAEIVSWLTKINSEMIIFSNSQTVVGLSRSSGYLSFETGTAISQDIPGLRDNREQPPVSLFSRRCEAMTTALLSLDLSNSVRAIRVGVPEFAASVGGFL
jgi:hypothetical protein